MESYQFVKFLCKLPSFSANLIHTDQTDHKVINLIIHRPLEADAETLPAEFTVKQSNQFIALDNSSSLLSSPLNLTIREDRIFRRCFFFIVKYDYKCNYIYLVD